MQMDTVKEATYPTAVIVDPAGGSPAYQGYQGTQRWSWGVMIASVCSVFCCTCIGLSALVTSLAAYTDHKVRDYAGSIRKYRRAKILAIVAIVIGCLGVVLYIVVIVLTVTAGGRRR